MRTSEGKLVLFELATGKQGEFWPIDAKALMALGTHATEAPQGVTPVVPPMPPKHVGMPLRPADVGPPDVSLSPAETHPADAPAVGGAPDVPKRGRKAAPPDKG